MAFFELELGELIRLDCILVVWEEFFLLLETLEILLETLLLQNPDDQVALRVFLKSGADVANPANDHVLNQLRKLHFERLEIVVFFAHSAPNVAQQMLHVYFSASLILQSEVLPLLLHTLLRLRLSLHTRRRRHLGLGLLQLPEIQLSNFAVDLNRLLGVEPLENGTEVLD